MSSSVCCNLKASLHRREKLLGAVLWPLMRCESSHFKMKSNALVRLVCPSNRFKSHVMHQNPTITEVNIGLYTATCSSLDYIYCAVAGKLVNQWYRSPNLQKSKEKPVFFGQKPCKNITNKPISSAGICWFNIAGIFMIDDYSFHVSVFWVICLNLPWGIGARFSL